MSVIAVKLPSRDGVAAPTGKIPTLGGGDGSGGTAIASVSIMDNPNFERAKEVLLARLGKMVHRMDEPDDRKKVYATIFVNGLHMVKPAVGIVEKEEKRKVMDKALNHMLMVRSENPEERYTDLDAKLTVAAELLLADKSLGIEIISLFVSRMLEDGVAGDKLMAYREVRSAMSGEVDSVFAEFGLSSQRSPSKITPRT